MDYIVVENVFLLSSKPYDFQGYKGFTFKFSRRGDGAVFKISAKEDLNELIVKNQGAPLLGDLKVGVAIAGDRIKPSFAGFSPR